MLRRDFIKTSVLTFSGVLIAQNALMSLPLLDTNHNRRKTGKPAYHLHGHRRSGCASPPELQRILENGITSLPL
ncbi:MAG: hypothetical protein CVT49_04440 [candidate division Zixibacteria bacterium HGW-Zixibacteria-1]|nr:MAG: hypothetical protein CVT49_04440 [candidate division Zixibacteria bacterium HGW-Zixibacteria-1]